MWNRLLTLSGSQFPQLPVWWSGKGPMMGVGPAFSSITPPSESTEHPTPGWDREAQSHLHHSACTEMLSLMLDFRSLCEEGGMGQVLMESTCAFEESSACTCQAKC